MRAEDSPETKFGFGIRARVDLEAEEWLFELAGLVPNFSKLMASAGYFQGAAQ